jgi:hypothetical protein
MGAGSNILRAHKVVGQGFFFAGAVGHGFFVDQCTVSQQLVREDIDFLFRLFALANNITRVVVGKAWLDTVADIVGQ